MVTDTKPLDKINEKCCSKCGETKIEENFIPKRNICKECRNKKSRENYNSTTVGIGIENEQSCTVCEIVKPISKFVKCRNICFDCNNQKRRTKYQNDEEHRKTLIKVATTYKHNKKLERDKIKMSEIGEGNKKCSCCDSIKPESRFRYNRLKCKDCERDDPVEKFKRYIRSRIYGALKHKELHTIDYLGCSSSEYLSWILSIRPDYTLENYGKVWHIDHVIPISRFDLDDKENQLIAFNWRNTTPLSATENLSKNNRILKPQIEQHLNHLFEYHKKIKIIMPQKFIDLFAKHLVDGNPLKQSLPLQLGNILEEHG